MPISDFICGVVSGLLTALIIYFIVIRYYERKAHKEFEKRQERYRKMI